MEDSMKTVFAALTLCAAVYGQTLNTLYTCSRNDIGYYPGGVAVGPDGRFYGVTLDGAKYDRGAAFELIPPAVSGGTWTAAVLHEFTEAEGTPGGGLWDGGITRGPDGVIYGIAEGGSYGLGEVFALRPPTSQGGPWREEILYEFGTGTMDGKSPDGPPVFGPDGALYGTTTYGGDYNLGIVYRLAPSSVSRGAWAEEILYNFGGYSGDGEEPQGALAIGSDGSLYGATETGGAGYGTIFQLSPPAASGGSWTESVLQAFGSGYGRRVSDWPSHGP
jgi:uncharacterized repeat protein (TIGR03803 family)